MKKLEIYTIEDLKEDLEKGVGETEAALRKWKSILDALRVLEDISIQITSFCLKHQDLGCKNCPILKFDYPCGHPYATFTMFYQELKKLKVLGESIYAILVAIDEEDRESKKHYV